MYFVLQLSRLPWRSQKTERLLHVQLPPRQGFQSRVTNLVVRRLQQGLYFRHSRCNRFLKDCQLMLVLLIRQFLFLLLIELLLLLSNKSILFDFLL